MRDKTCFWDNAAGRLSVGARGLFSGQDEVALAQGFDTADRNLDIRFTVAVDIAPAPHNSKLQALSPPH